MSSFHITKGTVDQTIWFIKHVGITAGMSNNPDLLAILAMSEEQKTTAVIPPIGQLTGIELIVNHTLDVLESKGMSAVLCSVCVKTFPLVEVAACVSPDPITAVPEQHKADFAQFFESPAERVAVIVSCGAHHVMQIIARHPVKVSNENMQAPPDNIGPPSNNKLETVD